MNAKNLRPENLIVPYVLEQHEEDKAPPKSQAQSNVDATRVEYKSPISTVKFPVDEKMIEGISGKEVAIISFWKKDPQASDFHCYHYFYIQNFVRLDES